MTPTEVKAIDDWRFANRVSSRGEAIRRLCQTALVLDEQLYGILEVVERAVEFAEQGHKMISANLRTIGWDDQETEAVVLARTILQRDASWVAELLDGLGSLRLDVIELENRVASLTEAPSLKSGERQAREASRAIDKIRQRLIDSDERSIDNMRLFAAVAKLTDEQRAALDEMEDADADEYLRKLTDAEGDLMPRTFEDENADVEAMLLRLKK